MASFWLLIWMVNFTIPFSSLLMMKNSDGGVLKGLKALLGHLGKFSDRMQYSFFMEERNTVPDGFKPKRNTFTVAEVLKSNSGVIVMDELLRLARLLARKIRRNKWKGCHPPI